MQLFPAKAKPKFRRGRKHGPHSRGHRLVNLDGRTQEAALMQRVRDELLAHLGHNPSTVERVMSERCCFLQLRLSMLDKKLLSGKDFTQIDSNVYLAWNNSLIRTLVKLGINPSKPRVPSRDAILAEA